MRAFWSLAGAHWPLSTPRRRLEAAVGVPAAAALIASGVLQLAALNEGQIVSCVSCGAAARLVSEEEHLVAVCTEEECPCESFAAEEARIVLDARQFVRHVATAFALDGVPGEDGVVIQLGRRMIGSEVVAVAFVPRPARAGVMTALRCVVRGGPHVHIVVVPDSTRVPADAPTEIAGVDVVWVGLDEVLVVGEQLRLDLRAIVSRRAFDGFVVATTFTGLSVSTSGAAWRGHPLAIAHSPLMIRLLSTLAARPGEYVTRRDLWRILFPDDHTREGNLARGLSPDHVDRRLRALVLGLRAAFRALGPLDGLPAKVIENRRGDEGAGGYWLALDTAQVDVS